MSYYYDSYAYTETVYEEPYEEEPPQLAEEKQDLGVIGLAYHLVPLMDIGTFYITNQEWTDTNDDWTLV